MQIRNVCKIVGTFECACINVMYISIRECTCAEADCVLLAVLVSDCRAVTVAVGARIS